MATSASDGTGKRSGGFWFWALLLLAAMLVFAVNFYLGQQQSAVVSEATANAGRLQVTALRIGGYGERAARGNGIAFDELKKSLELGNSILADLQAARGHGDGQVQLSFDTLSSMWARLAASGQEVIDREATVVNSILALDGVDQLLPGISNRMEEVLQTLIARGSPTAQVSVASRQLLLADRMQRRITDLRNSPDAQSVSDAIEGLARDGGLFGQVQEGLLEGSGDLGIRPIDVADARQILSEIGQDWSQIAAALPELAVNATDITSARAAVRGIEDSVQRVQLAGSEHGRVWEESVARQVFPNIWWGAASGAAAVIALLAMIVGMWRRDTARFRETAEVNQRNEEAILRLLDEMGSLAEGDLTVQATVTEDITGAIADSMNYTVEQLRNLVGTMTNTSNQVAESSQETLETAGELARSADQQSSQVNAATQRVTEMAQSIAAVSQNATLSADVAQRSVVIATDGAQVVRETIAGMDTIRDQIQETSKRIKRLGESSQEIGAIVELINDIAEQTNILALNAAIQAASAGEAGRGFAVVADEVQRLAERAGHATRRIETLVHTIQTDTNEAVGSMEQTTAGVVSGARLAENAGRALNQIEDVSQELARLIAEISDASRQQSQGASEIAETMDAIRGFTSNTAAGAGRTAGSVGKLAELATTLRRTVADFKLPENAPAGHDPMFDAENADEAWPDDAVDPDINEIRL